eukprot:scaffold7219_cov540-Prasinococcus_capsulatus_cf.AAC.5
MAITGMLRASLHRVLFPHHPAETSLWADSICSPRVVDCNGLSAPLMKNNWYCKAPRAVFDCLQAAAVGFHKPAHTSRNTAVR